MYTTKLAASLLVLLAWILGAAPARAETVICTAITALPAVITVPGVYCLTDNLATVSTTDNAIDIQTDNVVLDLNGFTLDGSAAGLGTNAFGIHAANQQNITIKNGTIRGFRQAIVLDDFGSPDASGGHLVEDIRAERNTEVGIQVKGCDNIVRNNQVVQTGGTTIRPTADIFGIFLQHCRGARVLNNDVDNFIRVGDGRGVGIHFTDLFGALAVNNRITSVDVGIEYVFTSNGKYRDNLTFNVTTPFSGGTNAGNNN